MAIPFTFQNQNGPIPLSELDSNFSYLYGLVSGGGSGGSGGGFYAYAPPTYTTDPAGITDQQPLITTFTTNIGSTYTGILDPYFNFSVTGYIPYGKFLLGSDWVAPQRLTSDGEFTGVGRVKINYSWGQYKNIAAAGGVYISGGNNVTVDGVWANNNPGGGCVTIDGGADAGKYGLEWADISHISSGDIRINLGNGFVNHNLIRSSHGGAITLSDNGGSSYGGAHMNTFFMSDFTSPTGLCNLSTHLNHTNLVIDAYYEGAIFANTTTLTFSATSGASVTVTSSGPMFTPTSIGNYIQEVSGGLTGAVALITGYTSQTVVTATTLGTNCRSPMGSLVYAPGTCFISGSANIYGNFHVLGFQGDAITTPLVGKNNWTLFSNDIAERNRKDYMPYTGKNILNGGEWEYLTLDPDGSGVYWPGCVRGYGHRVGSIVTDTTEPSGIGKGLQWVLTGGFGAGSAGFTIFVPAAPSTSDGGAAAETDVALTIYWRGTKPESVTVTRPDATSTYYGFDGVSVDGTWNLTRLCIKAASTGSPTQIICDYSTSGGTIVIGGMFATNEKAARLPAAQPIMELAPTANGSTLQLLDQYEQWGTVTQATVGVTGGAVLVTITFPTAFKAATTPVVTYSIEETDTTYTKTMTAAIMKISTVSNTAASISVYAPSQWGGKIHWRAIGYR